MLVESNKQINFELLNRINKLNVPIAKASLFARLSEQDNFIMSGFYELSTIEKRRFLVLILTILLWNYFTCYLHSPVCNKICLSRDTRIGKWAAIINL